MVELVIALAIFSSILLVIVSMLFTTASSHTKNRIDREVQENARRIMDVMVYEIQGAESIYTPTTTSTQLSLETTRYLPYGETTTFIDFYLCANTAIPSSSGLQSLCFKKETQDPVILNADSVGISSLTFTQVMNGTKPSIKIALTVQSYNPSNNASYASTVTLNSTAAIRKY